MTTIRYFVPEDGDLESEPNVFLSPKPRHPGAPPSFGQVRDAFPLPGQYHFRFKSALIPGSEREKGSIAVWMDFAEERQPVPTWKGTIVAKVTRINMEDDDDSDDNESIDHFNAPAPAPARAHTSSAGSIDDLFDSPPPAPPAQQLNHSTHSVPTAPSSADTAGSLLDFGHQPAPSHQQQQQQQNFHHQTPPTSAAHSDFFGMTAPAPSTGSAPSNTAGVYPNNNNNNMFPAHNAAQQRRQNVQNQPHQQQQQNQKQTVSMFSNTQPKQSKGDFGDFSMSKLNF